MKIVLPLFLLLVFLGLFIQPAKGSNCDNAKEYFQQAIELGDDMANLTKQEQLYRRAVEECPSYAEAHNNLGDVYEKKGRLDEAIAEYKKAIELKPEAPYPYFGLGDIYYKAGRYEQAMEWYKKGLKYDPNDRITQKRLSLLMDIQEKKVIRAETIRGMLSSHRGLGGVVSITFGEGLIPFDFDRYNIREDAKPQLNEIGKALQGILSRGNNKSADSRALSVLEIVGHTDIRGTDEYNMNLSRLRAKSVADYLAKKFNIPEEILLPTGSGKEAPLCIADKSESCHELNRRVEIIKRAR